MSWLDFFEFIFFGTLCFLDLHGISVSFLRFEDFSVISSNKFFILFFLLLLWPFNADVCMIDIIPEVS